MPNPSMKFFWSFSLLLQTTICFGQKQFNRADFYINTNECVNCHMFLPNYAITLENSDSLYMHLDVSTKRFGVKYLETMGIDISKFDTIFYEDLLTKYNGYFDSFIVIKDAGNTDTVLVKTPLILDTELGKVESPETMGCGETSNRVTPYLGEHTFILKDYLLQQVTKYYSIDNKITNCKANPFEVENNTQNYIDFLINNGVSMDLTRALHLLLVQLNKANPEVISVSSDRNDMFSACVKVPYVYNLATGDTAIAGIFLIQSPDKGVVGILNNNPSPAPNDNSKINTYFPVPSNGFIYNSDTLITEFKKSKTSSDIHEKYIGIMILDSIKRWFVLNKIYVIKSPSELKDHTVSLGFYHDIVYYRHEPMFFDCDDQQNYQFHIATDSTWFELYSVSKILVSDKPEFRLIYQTNRHLYISLFNPRTEKLTVQNQIPIAKNQYAIPQYQGLFILNEGDPSLPYQYLPFGMKQ